MNKRKIKQLEETPSTSNAVTKITQIQQLVSTLSLWTIQAIIFATTGLRDWNKRGKNGKVINFDVKDQSGEIRIVAFNDYAEKMNAMFNVGDTFQFSNGILKPADKIWCKLNHRFTIHVTKYSGFSKIEISSVSFKLNFLTIEDILKRKINKTVNLVAIATLAKDSEKVYRGSNRKEIMKKELLLIDESGKKIVYTIWQIKAEDFQFKNNMLLSITNAKITNYYGKSLTGGAIDLNPTNDASMKLIKWFTNNKSKIIFPTFEIDPCDSILLNFITKEMIEKGNIFYMCKASLIEYKDVISYDACENCWKKIVLNENNYICDICKHFSDTCTKKIMAKIYIVDPSKQVWLTLFENQLKQLLNEKNMYIDYTNLDFETFRMISK